jgi:hypothetical protein
LEKLRNYFARQGIVIPAAAMAATLTANAVQAAPAALASSVTGTALAGTGAAGVTTSLGETLLMTTKTKVALAAAAGIAVATAPIVWQHETITRLRDELAVVEKSRSLAADPATTAANSASRPGTNAVLNWRALESSDYRQYIANLRAAGCPEQTIRDIIVTDLDRAYGQRIAKISPPLPESRYWMRQYQTVNTSRDRAVKQIEEEKRTAIRALLGIDADDESHRRTGVPVPYDEGFEFVSADKRARLREIDREFKTLIYSNDAYRAGWNELDHQLQRRDIAVWKEEAIKALLSPAEFEEYDIRCGHHSQGLRTALSAFEPDEEEFRRILQLEKRFGKDQTYSDPKQLGVPAAPAVDPATGLPLPPFDPATEREFQKALRQELGEERYADYQLSRDNNYSFIHNVVEAYGLPAENARTLYDINKTIEKEAAAIRGNASLTVEARAAPLQALKKHAEAEALRLLGDEGFRAYQWQFGRWLADKTAR